MKYLNFKPLALTAIQAALPTVNSDWIDLSQIYKLSVQISTNAGTATTGTIQLQVSNDIVDTNYAHNPTPTHWSNLGSSVALAAPATNYLIPVQNVSYRSMRIVFTGDPANDATIDVKIMALAI